jgi:hypothetical protein
MSQIYELDSQFQEIFNKINNLKKLSNNSVANDPETTVLKDKEGISIETELLLDDIENTLLKLKNLTEKKINKTVSKLNKLLHFVEDQKKEIEVKL